MAEPMYIFVITPFFFRNYLLGICYFTKNEIELGLGLVAYGRKWYWGSRGLIFFCDRILSKSEIYKLKKNQPKLEI